MILLIILLIIGIASLSVSLDPDLGWHLFLGKYIVEQKTLVHNFIGYNVFEHLMRPDHEWLSNIILYLVSKNFGYIGLSALFTLLLATTFFLLYKVYRKLSGSSYPAYFILVFATLPFFTAFSIRLQFLLIFGLSLYLFFKFLIQKPTTRMALYFLSGLIINNLHGGFVTLLPAIALLEFDTFKQQMPFKKCLGQYLLLLLSLFSPVLINPYGLKYFDLLLSYGHNYYQHWITEWLPIFNPTFASYSLVVIFPLSVIVFIILIEKFFLKLQIFEIVLLLIYGYLGIAHMRQFPIFIILLGLYAAKATPYLIKTIKPTRLLKISSLMFVALSIAVAISYNGNPMSFFKRGTWSDNDKTNCSYPVKAMEYITKNAPAKQGNFLNPYDWGGFIIWVYPESKIFIDGRGPEKLIDGKKSIMQEYIELGKASDSSIGDKLKKYNITYVMIQKKSSQKSFSKIANKLLGIKSSDPPVDELRNFLSGSSEWSEVFNDEMSIVYYLK